MITEEAIMYATIFVVVLGFGIIILAKHLIKYE